MTSLVFLAIAAINLAVAVIFWLLCHRFVYETKLDAARLRRSLAHPFPWMLLAWGVLAVMPVDLFFSIVSGVCIFILAAGTLIVLLMWEPQFYAHHPATWLWWWQFPITESLIRVPNNMLDRIEVLVWQFILAMGATGASIFLYNRNYADE